MIVIITNVYRVSRARSSKRSRIYGLYIVRAGGGGGGGGRVYEIKTLRSNLAPEEGEGRLFEGGVYIIEQVR